MSNRRFPGINPFQTNEKDRFFGREKDIRDLYSLIGLEKTVVLFGKSGHGKSSLLNAGIIPRFNSEPVDSERRFEPVTIKFGAWVQGRTPPVLCARKIIEAALKGSEPAIPLDSLGILEETRNSLWATLYQTGHKRIVLIFDQFEEFFTYPLAQQERFADELSQVLHGDMPLEIAGNFVNLTEETQEYLAQGLHIKAVFAIREDRLHLLDKLQYPLPAIFARRYALYPLPRSQAKEALINPAGLPGFETPAFGFTPEAITRILDFLADKEGKVETNQLQILAESFERSAEKNGITIFSINEIGALNDIVRGYYFEKINAIPNYVERNAVRKLCEEGLAQEGDPPARLNLHEAQIQKFYGINAELLEALVLNRLLRAEPGAGGGYTYELPHDTLLGPVLESKRERTEYERQKQKEIELALHQAKLAAENAAANLRKRWVIFGSIVVAILVFIAAMAFWVALQKTIIAQGAANQAVTSILAQARQDILRLDYNGAFSKLTIAADLGVKRDSVAFELMEIAFVRYHIKLDTPSILRPIYLAESLLDRQVFSRDNILEKIIWLNEERFEYLSRRYFPQIEELQGGTFMMGRNPTLEEGNSDEIPSHEVTIAPFGLANTETSFWQWYLFVASKDRNILDYSPSSGLAGNQPAVNIDWFDACEYANWLSEMMGKKPFYYIDSLNRPARRDWEVKLLPDGNGYRLPSESEWEFTARGNGEEEYHFFAGSDLLDSVGWYWSNSSFAGVKRTQPVAQKNPVVVEKYKLFYDMTGNVWEWCWNNYDPNSYGKSANQGSNTQFQTGKVLRGGSWFDNPYSCRVSARNRDEADTRVSYYGFRVACHVD